MTTFEAVVLAIVEGITEYLPISSTGHLIITEAFLKMKSSPMNKVFIVNIQFGAILAVLLLYFKKFFNSLDFYLKLMVAFLPAAILGFLLNDFIDSLLENVVVVALSLILGGIVLVWSDRFFKEQLKEGSTEQPTETDSDQVELDDHSNLETIKEVIKKREPISFRQAFIIGCYQCLAMIPGVSRSAATIFGGLTQKLGIKTSAEFSFFLAVPTIAAASVYKTYKGIHHIKGSDIELLLIGNVVAFVVAVIAIRTFIGIITRFGLRFFGYYRIVIGVLILALLAMGFDLKIPV